MTDFSIILHRHNTTWHGLFVQVTVCFNMIKTKQGCHSQAGAGDFPRLLSKKNRRKIEPKESLNCLILCLLVILPSNLVFVTALQDQVKQIVSFSTCTYMLNPVYEIKAHWTNYLIKWAIFKKLALLISFLNLITTQWSLTKFLKLPSTWAAC